MVASDGDEIVVVFSLVTKDEEIVDAASLDVDSV